MRNELNIHDDILFDRLVDGELSAGERRRLLASLDERPDGWRRCALAFLEAQSWTEELGEVVREAESITPAATIPVAIALARRAAKGHGFQWLAIAAGLMLAFTLGLMWRGNDGRVPLANVEPNPQEQIAVVTPPPSSASPDEAQANDALTLWVRDDTGQTRPLRVPLVDAGALDQHLGLEFQTGLPANVRDELQDRGYNVQSKKRYAPLWLENGRPMIVPVEDTRIVPVSQNVY